MYIVIPNYTYLYCLRVVIRIILYEMIYSGFLTLNFIKTVNIIG